VRSLRWQIRGDAGHLGGAEKAIHDHDKDDPHAIAQKNDTEIACANPIFLSNNMNNCERAGEVPSRRAIAVAI
jgi:hypothetical protein